MSGDLPRAACPCSGHSPSCRCPEGGLPHPLPGPPPQLQKAAAFLGEEGQGCQLQADPRPDPTSHPSILPIGQCGWDPEPRGPSRSGHPIVHGAGVLSTVSAPDPGTDGSSPCPGRAASRLGGGDTEGMNKRVQNMGGQRHSEWGRQVGGVGRHLGGSRPPPARKAQQLLCGASCPLPGQALTLSQASGQGPQGPLVRGTQSSRQHRRGTGAGWILARLDSKVPSWPGHWAGSASPERPLGWLRSVPPPSSPSQRRTRPQANDPRASWVLEGSLPLGSSPPP